MFIRHVNRNKRSIIRLVQGSILGLGLFSLFVLKEANVIGNAEPEKSLDISPLEYNSPALDSSIAIGAFSSRHLLAAGVSNCTPPAVEQFPRGFFTMEQRRQGAVTVHILISLYMFLGLAVACDDYFVPSLEKISDAMNLQSDVAGATFMAAGSSAPELATAVIGVFIAKDDIGLGAVVGSAVFNIMFVISVCALFAGMVVYLHWFPLARDCLFYLISILALTIVIMDEWVQWYEAAILLVWYAIYIVIMYFNPRLEKFFVAKFACCGLPQKDELNQLMAGKSEKQRLTGDADNNTDDTEEKSYDVKELKPEEPDSPFSPPVGCLKRFLWLLALPMTVAMYFTTPDCRRERWSKFYILTFTMSLVWISVYSYIMVWMITVIGYTLNIPDTVMGLTFVAAGVSVPDAIASLIVVQDGFGDMAVSNAVGSNVFDILICLGLPWTLKTLLQGGAPVEVYSAGLTYATLVLLSTVVFLLLATHINGWKLDIKYGVILMIMYFVVLAVCCLFELNIFGDLHPATCISNW